MVRTPVLRTVEAAAGHLEGRAFEGFYVERRLTGTASPVGSHRPHYSAAVLLPPEEDELIRDLVLLDDQLKIVSPATLSSYEAGPPPCVLARINDAPLGCYWFQIASVSLEHDQVVYDLNRLRYLPRKTFPSLDSSSASNKSRVGAEDLNIKINAETFVSALRFVLVVIAASVVGSFKVIEFLGNFTLRFMRETSIFMEKSTPMFFGVLSFLSRCTSAGFAFVTMMIRGNKPIRVQNFAPLEYDDRDRFARNRRGFS